MDVPSGTPAAGSETAAQGCAAGVFAEGGAFSLVTFLLATQEKVTRAPGGRAEKTGYRYHHSEAAACIRAMDRDQNSRFCAAHR